MRLHLYPDAFPLVGNESPYRCAACLAPFFPDKGAHCQFCGQYIWGGGGWSIDPVHEEKRALFGRRLALLRRQGWSDELVIGVLIGECRIANAAGTRQENWISTIVAVIIDAGMACALHAHEKKFPTAWRRAKEDRA